MDISYASNKLEKQLRDQASIRANFTKVWKGVWNRLSELHTCGCLEDIPQVPPPRRHKLSNGNWALNVSPNQRMILQPLNGTDPKSITAVKIVAIDDYH